MDCPPKKMAVVRGGRFAEVVVSGGSNVRICFCPSCG